MFLRWARDHKKHLIWSWHGILSENNRGFMNAQTMHWTRLKPDTLSALGEEQIDSGSLFLLVSPPFVARALGHYHHSQVWLILAAASAPFTGISGDAVYQEIYHAMAGYHSDCYENLSVVVPTLPSSCSRETKFPVSCKAISVHFLLMHIITAMRLKCVMAKAPSMRVLF